VELIQLVVVLIVIGVLLWVVNTYGGQFMDAKILGIINAVVVIAVVLWLLALFFPGLQRIRVPPP
jgi:low temperature requirement protein LtrA